MPRYREDYQKTVLFQDNIQNLLRKVNKTPLRKGIDIRLFALEGHEKDCQTAVTFLTNRINPAKEDRKDKEDIDKLLSEALDKVLLSDNVKSAKDYKKVGGGSKMQIETNLSNLEDSDLDSYVKHSKMVNEKKGFVKIDY